MAVTAAMDMYTIQLCRLPGRLREQARSHSLIVGHQVDRRRLLPQLICSACSNACLHLMITTRHLPFTMGEFVQIVQVIHIEPAILLAGTTEEADADIQLTQQFWA